MSALTECKHWRWLPGIQVTGPFAGVIRIQDDRFGMWGDPAPGCLPVLSDPATVGIIEHLAREAWGEVVVRLEYAYFGTEPWQIWADSGTAPICYAPTRGEAWAAALLAAP